MLPEYMMPWKQKTAEAGRPLSPSLSPKTKQWKLKSYTVNGWVLC